MTEKLASLESKQADTIRKYVSEIEELQGMLSE